MSPTARDLPVTSRDLIVTARDLIMTARDLIVTARDLPMTARGPYLVRAACPSACVAVSGMREAARVSWAVFWARRRPAQRPLRGEGPRLHRPGPGACIL